VHFSFRCACEDSEQFTNKLRPCCEADDPSGYCGKFVGFIQFQFKLDIDNVNSYFYLDEMNPTHAGWKAVMEQLQGTINDFLNADD
jgi:hypothetical protein